MPIKPLRPGACLTLGIDSEVRQAPRAIDHIEGKTMGGKVSNSIYGVSKQIHFVTHSL